MSAFASAAITSLRSSPEDWVMSNYTIEHRPSRIEIWVGNGFWFYGGYRPRQISFSLLDKFRFGRAYRRWSRHQPADLIAALSKASPVSETGL